MRKNTEDHTIMFSYHFGYSEADKPQKNKAMLNDGY